MFQKLPAALATIAILSLPTLSHAQRAPTAAPQAQTAAAPRTDILIPIIAIVVVVAFLAHKGHE